MSATATDVKSALRGRWPAAENVFIEEAPDGPMRMGRKLDVLVVSTWRSRGFELDGVEVKVSASDWKRELDEPEKADWWWRHVNRFWLAVPVALAPKVRNELPTGWGLLATSEAACKVVVKPERHDAKAFTWAETVGLLRAACDAGPGALNRAEQKGYQRGKDAAQVEAERRDPDAIALQRVARLEGAVSAFREASGIDITGGYGTEHAARLGRLVALVDKGLSDPSHSEGRMRRLAQQATAEGERLTALADSLAAAMAPEAQSA